ncbi:MAG: hypothetical protein HYY06_33360 [Deltaproteobacteria bacterium]|nr:hypothetical protein [Deltaproteobacteria bacterium]
MFARKPTPAAAKVALALVALASCYESSPVGSAPDASIEDWCGGACVVGPDATVAPSWQCQDLADGSIECVLAPEATPGGEGWRCFFDNGDGGGDDDSILCDGPPGERPGHGDFECVDQGVARCRDDDPPYPDAGGDSSWDCYFDELGGLTCTTAELDDPTPACEPGTVRWCNQYDYDNWCKQACGVDEQWGPCGADCDDDRPNNDCACRHFYFTPECCERPDCVIPEDHVPEVCPTDGGLCGYCNRNDDCGGQDDLCLLDGHGGTFCGAACDPDDGCPDGFECSPIHDYSGNVVTEQCVPVDGCDP